MSLPTELNDAINSLHTKKEDIKNAIRNKNVSVPTTATLSDLPNLISLITTLPSGFSKITGGNLSVATSLTDTAKVIIEHNLGVRPDVIVCWLTDKTLQSANHCVSIVSMPNGSFLGNSTYTLLYRYKGATAAYASGSLLSSSSSYGIPGSLVTTSTFALKCPTSSYPILPGNYKWIAIKF